MAKKKIDQQAEEAAKLAEQRRRFIAEFNLNNQDDIHIDPTKTASEDDIKEAKEAWEECVKGYKFRNEYLIADKENAKRVATFLRDFVTNGFWSGEMFKGVVQFVDLINNFLKEVEVEEKDLVLEYAPMQFAYVMLENYVGRGLEDAKRMLDIWNEYVPILDTFKDHVNWIQVEVQKSKILEQIWNLRTQGFYAVHEVVAPEAEPVLDEEAAAGLEAIKKAHEEAEEAARQEYLEAQKNNPEA